jgi:hypothetical protein
MAGTARVTCGAGSFGCCCSVLGEEVRTGHVIPVCGGDSKQGRAAQRPPGNGSHGGNGTCGAGLVVSDVAAPFSEKKSVPGM